MWPFQKKNLNVQRLLDKPLPFFMSFGSNDGYKEIYTDKQDNQLLIKSFNNISEVAAPIFKYMDGASQIFIKSNIPEVQRLLDKPNYYQGWNEWISSVMLYKRLLGNSIIDAFSTLNIDSTSKPKALFIFSPEYTKIETTSQTDFRFNTIQKYIFDSQEINKDAIEVDSKNILHLREVTPNFTDDQYLFGQSRYTGCSANIESIRSGYSAKVNLYKNGPRLIMTGKTQGDFASSNTTEDIEIVQERMKKYGYGGDKYNNLITDVPLDVVQASLNVAQLRITENNSSDFQRLCDAQNIDSKVFSESGGATFSNKAAALKDFYNNPFKSEMEGTVYDLNDFLANWWPSLELTIDYSSISEIIDAQLESDTRLFDLTKLGMYTRNQYNVMTGNEEVPLPDFNEYYFLTSNGWIPLNNMKDENIQDNQIDSNGS